MVTSSTIATGATLFASVVSIAQAATLKARQSSFTFECDGIRNPDWSGCDGIASTFSSSPASLVSVSPGGTANQMVFGNGDDVNCIVTVQINEQGFAVTYQQVSQGLAALQDTCRPQALGGTSVETNGKWSVAALSNPDYRGGAKVKARDTRIATTGSLEGSALFPQVRNIAARADGDTSFGVGIHSTGVLGEKAYVGYGIPGTGTYTTTNSDTKSTSYTTSVSVSADILGIVSTTVGFEFSTSKSSTTTSGVSIPFQCAANENAYLYLQPLLETWSGALSPSGDKLVVSRPQTGSDGHTLAQYDYECRD